MSEPSPLAGLTCEQADEAIDRLYAKIDGLELSVTAAQHHLDQMTIARQTHRDPGSLADSDGPDAVRFLAGVAEASGEVL
jgi:hypothetical protein